MSKTVPSQAIQFSISTQFSSISLKYRTLSGATTPGQSRPGSDGNKGVLRIPQNSIMTGTSTSDCLSKTHVGGVLFLFGEAVVVFYSLSRLSKIKCNIYHILNSARIWRNMHHMNMYHFPHPSISVDVTCARCSIYHIPHITNVPLVTLFDAIFLSVFPYKNEFD